MNPTRAELPQRGDRLWAKAGVLFGLAVIVFAIAIMNQHGGHDWGDDFSFYLRQTQALTRGDASQVLADNRFTVDNSSWHSFSPYSYPWGFPILLSPFFKVFGANYAVLKVVIAACLAGAIWCYGRLLTARVAFPAAIVMVLLVGLSTEYIGWADTVLSEFPYLMVAFGALCWMDRCRERGWFDGPKWWPRVVLGFLVGYAYTLRKEGVAVLIALAAAHIALIAARWRQHRRLATGDDVLAAGGAVNGEDDDAVEVLQTDADGFDEESFSTGWPAPTGQPADLGVPDTPTVPGSATRPVDVSTLQPASVRSKRWWARLALPYVTVAAWIGLLQVALPNGGYQSFPGTGLRQVVPNVKWYRDVFAQQIGLKKWGVDHLTLFGNETLALVMLTVVVTLAVIGVVAQLLTAASTDAPLIGYFASVSAVFAITPFHEGRYLFSISPLILYFAYQAAVFIAEALPRPTAPIIGMLVLAPMLVANLQMIRQRTELALDYRAPIWGPSYPTAAEMFVAVEQYTGEDDVVAFFRARLMSFETDRPALQLTTLGEITAKADWYAMAKDSTYSQVLVTDEMAAEAGFVRTWENQHFVLWRVPRP